MLLALNLFSQDVKQGSAALGAVVGENPGNNALTDSTWAPTTAVFFEVLGKSWGSLNIDFRKRINHAWGIGINIAGAVWPSVMYYSFGGKKFNIEIGGGASVMIDSRGYDGMALHGSFGYRYQKKKGVLFRACFAPFYGISLGENNENTLIPWFGLSLGYSF